MDNTVTVLDSLTWPNPEIHYDEGVKSATRNGHYFTPQKIVPWDEFNMETIANIGGGSLLRTIQRTPSLQLVPPNVEAEHCSIEDETGTRFLLETWNRDIVQQCLNSVESQLPTCKWNPRVRAKTSESSSMLGTASTSYASTPGRNGVSPGPSSSLGSLLQIVARQAKKKKKLRPDAGATAPCNTHGSLCPAGLLERLPKDYKASTNWTSLDATDQREDLGVTLRKRGMMEYASIPWSASNLETRQSNALAAKGHVLTFNLALWFIHVLAACQFHPNWSYDALESEDITIRECTTIEVPPTPESEERKNKGSRRQWSRSRSRSRKRPREDPGEDYALSLTSDSFGLTDSFRSFRGGSAATDSTCVNETPRWLPKSGLAVSNERLDNEESSPKDGSEGNVKLRRSKRVHAQTDK
ncbi:hypothetical protein PWT90_06609 [Aphanocladium album]|nr:hypothetical protein PWT90_06609 [Aphanocladium album]